MQAFKCSTIKYIEDYGTVRDTRDNNVYSIAKLKDGLCWMTQDLRIGAPEMANRVLTPDNTDITSSYTLPASSTSGFNDDAKDFLYVDPTYGGYYNYNAATAGTGTLITSGNVADSICPKNWKLPTKTEMTSMLTNYNDNKNGELLKHPINISISKGFYAGNNDLAIWGEGNSFWTSTKDESTGLPVDLNTWKTNGEIDTRSSFPRYGESIRCVSHDI